MLPEPEKVSGGRWKGVLWKDGQPTYFTEEVGTEVTGLYVKEGKYHPSKAT